MPDGSREVTGYKAHTAGSRQQTSYHLIASDVAERKDIVRRQPLGTTRLPDRDDVIRNIAMNFGRFETKRTASSVRLTAESAAHDAGRRLERVQTDTRDRLRMVREYLIERLTPALERIRQMQERVLDLRPQHERRREQDRGLGLGL